MSLPYFLKVIIRDGLVVLNDFMTLLPVKHHYYLFESFNGKDISDNPYAIYKQMINDNPRLINTCIWGVQPHMYRKLHKKYPNIKMVRRFLPQWCYYMARSQYWVFNSRMPTWWKKNKHTTYLQTWHGTPLKKLGLDMKQVKMPGTSTSHYKRHFVKETKRWDYLVAPNLYSEKIFKRAFQFKHHFLKTGYPRNDVLYQNNNQKVIRHLKAKILGRQNLDKNVITYAPTWRDDDYIHKGAYKFEFRFNLGQFFKHTSKNTFLIIRPHYLIKSKIAIPKKFQDRVKVLRTTDISEIYLITNLLITDYSSVMFDFANLNRPMLFYAYDLSHYENTLRGFYLNYRKDLPGPLAVSPQELYHYLNVYSTNHGFPQYQKQLDQFRKLCCTWENGTASKKIAKLLEK